MPPPRKNNKLTVKPAFTLAEILITLGIIGIVAALTLPTLIANHQKKVTVTKLKKAYSLASQVIENDEISVWDWDNWDNAETILREHFVPKLQVAQVYPPKSSYKAMCDKQYIWLGGIGINSPFINSTASVRLNDGTCLGLNPKDNSQWEGGYNYNFFIDINGPQNPNIAGIDLFIFYINKNGQLRPFGDTFTDEKLNGTATDSCNYDKQATRTFGGYSCAAKIIRDGWEIKKDYPWRVK